MKKTLIASVCAISLIGGLAVTATAQRGDRLEQVDTNGDGNVTIAELEAQKAERFASADTNGDNLMSFAEF
ncbi:MAG: calcium sensor EFh, partial [Pseudomonadota bacterium]